MSTYLRNLAGPLAFAFGAILLAALSGLAFAGWSEHAPNIFMALVEQGMAWCF
jgi:hypothetical protein